MTSDIASYFTGKGADRLNDRDLRPDNLPMSATPPISASEAEITHMRSSHMAMLRGTYRAVMPEDRWQALLSFLPSDTRELLDQDLDPSGWLPVKHTIALRDAFIRVGLASPFAVRGQLTAEAFLASEIGQRIGCDGDPIGAVTHFAAVLAELQRGGRLLVEEVRPGRARWTFWGLVPFPEYSRDFGRAFFERLLQLQGAPAARVRYIPPEPGHFDHRFVADW